MTADRTGGGPEDQGRVALRLVGRACDNEDGPGGAINTGRSLTRSLDYGEEGLAMQATSAQFGDPRLPKRFWAKVRIADSGCWEWTRWSSPEGYGRFVFGNKGYQAHRVAYEALVAPIPDGFQIDHLCYNPPCCNPAHLEPVTQAENRRRQRPVPVPSHCSRGHLRSEHWVILSSGRGRCGACAREDTYRVRAEKRAQGIRRKATHCRYGHRFTPENRTFDERGHQVCLTCRAERQAAS